jgi:homoserine dehydrogenase
MSLKPVNVGLLGLGTVGTGTLKVLARNADEIARRAGRGVRDAEPAPCPSRAPTTCRASACAPIRSRWCASLRSGWWRN